MGFAADPKMLRLQAHGLLRVPEAFDNNPIILLFLYCIVSKRALNLSRRNPYGEAMHPIIRCIACSLLLALPCDADALTAEEIVLLKQHGVSETTIQMMIESEQRAHAFHGSPSQPGMGVATIPRPGGGKAIIYSTGPPDATPLDAAARLREERAWEMLRHLIIDTRSGAD